MPPSRVSWSSVPWGIRAKTRRRNRLNEPDNFTYPACFYGADGPADDAQRIEITEGSPALPKGIYPFGTDHPPALRKDSVIAVASVAPGGGLSDFSCFGAKNVDVAAPGGTGRRKGDLAPECVDDAVIAEDIFSTIPEIVETTGWDSSKWPRRSPRAKYAALHGTSQAAPIVAAAAALIWSHPNYHSLSAVNIKQVLIQKARVPKESLAGKCRSGGVLDLAFLIPTPVAAAPKPAHHHRETSVPPAVRTKAEVEFNRGVEEFWAGRYELAARSLRGAAALDPERPLYPYFLAFTEANRGDFERASRHLRTALKLEKLYTMPDYGRQMVRIQGANRVALERARKAYLEKGTLPPDFDFLAAWPVQQWRISPLPPVLMARVPSLPQAPVRYVSGPVLVLR